MSNILKYLPTPSDYAVKVESALGGFVDDMYVVGSGARKVLYGLKNTPNGYDFVISVEDNSDADVTARISKQLEAQFPGKVKLGAWGHPNGIEVDCEAFTLKLRVQPIDKFLRTVRFAGDGVAVCLEDDRPVVVPEYMSLPPVIQIIKTDEKDAQNDKVWVDKHIETLTQFQKELFNLVSAEVEKNDLGATEMKAAADGLIDAKGN